MHELSIVEGIIKTVEEQKKIHHFIKVNQIDIVCGNYNCLSEENLQFCFDALSRSTFMEGAHLNITRRKEQFNCKDCSTIFESDNDQTTLCTSCHSENIFPVLTNTIYIETMEVD